MKASALVRDVPKVFTAPVLERHRKALFGPYATDIRPRTQLIPVEDCHHIIATLNRSSAKTGVDLATEIAQWMFKLYPREQRVPDADTYVRGIVAVFAEFPEHLCRAAVNHITKHRSTYPTRAEVNDVLSAMQSQENRLMDVARAQLAEHVRRDARKGRPLRIEKPKMTPGERLDFIDKLKEKYPDAGLRGRNAHDPNGDSHA